MSPAPRLLDKAATVQTAAFRATQLVAQQACERGQVAGFFGEAGMGKTHALTNFVEHTDIDSVWITSTPSPGRKEIFEELLIEITGTCDSKRSARELRRDCLDQLSDRDLAVIVDEAQHLSSLWLQQLRSLHDHRDARWALLLVGGPGVARKLKSSPELWSRIALRVDFTPMEGDELLAALGAYHPVLANTDPDLLLDVDGRWCHGNWRNWHNFLENALPLLGKSGHLTQRVVRAAAATYGAR